MKRAHEYLSEGADTFRERNAIYGDNYLDWGRVMKHLHPEGINLDGSIKQWNRIGLWVQVISKLTRYAQHFDQPHNDSIHDAMVYLAMLQEVDNGPDI